MSDIYVSIAQMGNCKVCGKYDDLRYGVCGVCCDRVSGRLIGPGKHELWETTNPDNRWIYSEEGH